MTLADLRQLQRQNRLEQMMHDQSYSAEPYREGMDFTDEAWAYGLRALPGNFANSLQDLAEYTMGGQDRPNYVGNALDQLTQVNEMGYTPQTEWEQGVAFAPELVYDPIAIAGMPYAAYKGVKGLPNALGTISEEMARTPMRNMDGAIVWQGSPHKYDGIPDPSKIGTGEGAQAYGYGHYYGGAEATGRAYQQSLSPGGVVNHSIDRINDALDLEEALGKYVPSYIIDNATRRAGKMGGVDEAIAQIDELAPQLIKANNGYGDDMLLEKEVLQAYRDKIKVSDVNTGYLYKLDLDDNAIANMLDWDAPLSEQPEAVRNALKSIGIDNAVMPKNKDGAWFVSINGDILGKGMESYEEALEAIERGWVYGRDDAKLAFSGSAVTGGDIHKAMVNQWGSAEEASKRLKEIGIPGIKYYDGNSRAAGEGTRNFVVFPGNENLIAPLERNGEPLGNLSAFKGQLGAVGVKDLPMDEASRMARAREMGDIGEDLYHGTDRDFPAFGIANRGDATKAKSARAATWLVDDPSTASGYADYAAKDAQVQKLIDASYAAERRNDWDKANDLMRQAEELEQELFTNPQNGQLVMPLRAKGNFMEFDAEGATWGDLDDNTINDLIKDAKRGGYDGLKVLNLVDEAQYGVDNPATHYAVFDPKNIRSRFAKFDPTKKDSADLLASKLLPIPAGLLGLGLYDNDSN